MTIGARDLYAYQIALMYGIFRKLKEDMKKIETDVGMDIHILHALNEAPTGMTFGGIKAFLELTGYNAERANIRIKALIGRGVIDSEWRFGIRFLTISPDMMKIIKTYRAVPYGHRLMLELNLSRPVLKLLEKIRHHE